MLLGGVGVSRPFAAGIAAACLGLVGSGCGSAGGTLHTTARHSAKAQPTSRAPKKPATAQAKPKETHATKAWAPTGRTPQVERARKAVEAQITPILQAQGATSTQISCVVRQIEGLSELRFQTIISSSHQRSATLRSMEARCSGA